MRFDLVRRLISAIALALAVAVSTVGISPSSPLPPFPQAAGPTTSFETWFDVEQPPTVPFEAVQLVVDSRGDRGWRGHFGGPGDITMLEGEMTMWIGDEPLRAYAAGELFVEPFGGGGGRESELGAGEPAGDVPDPRRLGGDDAGGRERAAGRPASAGGGTRFESRMRFESAPRRYEVGHMLQTYGPGAWSVSEAPKEDRLMRVVPARSRC